MAAEAKSGGSLPRDILSMGQAVNRIGQVIAAFVTLLCWQRSAEFAGLEFLFLSQICCFLHFILFLPFLPVLYFSPFVW